MSANAAIAVRRKRAVESFKTAADCIGSIEPGAPMENPYLKIRAQQAEILKRMGRIKSDRVMALLQDSTE